MRNVKTMVYNYKPTGTDQLERYISAFDYLGEQCDDLLVTTGTRGEYEGRYIRPASKPNVAMFVYSESTIYHYVQPCYLNPNDGLWYSMGTRYQLGWSADWWNTSYSFTLQFRVTTVDDNVFVVASPIDSGGMFISANVFHFYNTVDYFTNENRSGLGLISSNPKWIIKLAPETASTEVTHVTVGGTYYPTSNTMIASPIVFHANDKGVYTHVVDSTFLYEIYWQGARQLPAIGTRVTINGIAFEHMHHGYFIRLD